MDNSLKKVKAFLGLALQLFYVDETINYLHNWCDVFAKLFLSKLWFALLHIKRLLQDIYFIIAINSNTNINSIKVRYS